MRGFTLRRRTAIEERDRSRPRRRRLAVTAALASVLATITAAPPVQAAGILATQDVAYVVGGDGRLYHVTPSGTPVLVTTQVAAPPGAGVATVRLGNGSVTAVAIGYDGGLVSITPGGGSVGGGVVPIGTRGLAAPGSPVSAVYNSASGAIEAFFAGGDGAVYNAVFQASFPSGGSLRTVANPGTAPLGGVVAAQRQTDGTIGVVFTGASGALYTARSNPAGGWITTAVTSPNIAKPGGGVAVAGWDVFFTGQDGRVYRTGPLPDPWRLTTLAPAGSAPAGARLTAAAPSAGPVYVFYAAANGAINLLTNQTGTWQGPYAATAAGTATPGGPVSGLADATHVLVGWCGNEPRRIVIPRPLPIPPPPGWQLPVITGSLPTQPGFDVSVALLG